MTTRPGKNQTLHESCPLVLFWRQLVGKTQGQVSLPPMSAPPPPPERNTSRGSLLPAHAALRARELHEVSHRGRVPNFRRYGDPQAAESAALPQHLHPAQRESRGRDFSARSPALGDGPARGSTTSPAGLAQGEGQAQRVCWAALAPDHRAQSLLAMPHAARLQLYRSETRELVSQALCEAFAYDAGSGAALLLELDPVWRAEVLSFLPATRRAVVVAGMQWEDRMKTLQHMSADCIGPGLMSLSPTDVLKTFKNLDEATRQAIFPDLESSSQTAILLSTPVMSRLDLLVQLRPTDRVEALLSLPVRECCGTVRALPPFHAECVLLEMDSESRGHVLLGISHQDLSRLMLAMPVDKQVGLFDGMMQSAQYHAFRSLSPGTKVVVFDHLSHDERCGLVDKMSPTERGALIASLPSNIRANLLRILAPKEAVQTLRGLDKPDILDALADLNPAEQAELLRCMPGTDRRAILSLMQSHERAIIVSQEQVEDGFSLLRSLNHHDIANTLSQMTPGDKLSVLSKMTISERAKIFSVTNQQERADVALMMMPESLASILPEMNLTASMDLVNALPADKKAQVLCSLADWDRAMMIKTLMESNSKFLNESDFLDTLRGLGPQILRSTLEQMSEHDKVALLLVMPARERARILELMPPLECARILDCFLLEDRGNTICNINTSTAALVLAEMLPNQKAILLAAVADCDRLSIIAAMTAQDIGNVLSSLPPADTVAILRSLDARRSAEALEQMVPEEQAIILEAIGTKERAAILSNMGFYQASYSLSRLGPRECAATLRLLEGGGGRSERRDELLKGILNEIPDKLRTAVLQECPIKFRVRALAMIDASAVSAFLDHLDPTEAASIVKSMPNSMADEAIEGMSLESKVSVITCLDTHGACRVMGTLSAREVGDILLRLPTDTCCAILKHLHDEHLHNAFSNMEKEGREKLLTELPEKLQTKISHTILPAQSLSEEFVSDRPPKEESIRHVDSPGGPVPLVIPVRRRKELTPSCATASDGDKAVTVKLWFNEDYDWLTADEQRQISWSEWLRGIICNAIAVPTKRIQIQGLERGSVCLLLRCLPQLEIAHLTALDVRSALDLAEEVLTFASENGRNNLPKFIRGTLYSEGGESIPLSPAAKSAHTPSGTRLLKADNSPPNDESCGVGIAFAPTADGKNLTVLGMIPGGHAEKSGLISVGDIVSTVDGQNASGWPILKLAHRIRGPVSTRIQIGFKSSQNGIEKNIDLPRIPITGSPKSALPMRRLSNCLESESRQNFDDRGNDSPVIATTPMETADLLFQSVPRISRPSKKSLADAVDRALFQSPEIVANQQTQEIDSSSMRASTSSVGLNEASHNTHEIWGKLLQLDESIQRRDSDMRVFTESLLRLQNDASISSSKSSPAAFGMRPAGDFFYA